MSTPFDESLEKVIAAIESADYQKATVAARRCVELEPDNPEGLFYLGESLSGAEKPEEAIVAYEAGLKLSPVSARRSTCTGSSTPRRARSPATRSAAERTATPSSSTFAGARGFRSPSSARPSPA